jgi:hypothetical protein
MIIRARRRRCKPWPSLVFIWPEHWTRRLRVRSGRPRPLGRGAPFTSVGLQRWRTPRWHHLMVKAWS